VASDSVPVANVDPVQKLLHPVEVGNSIVVEIRDPLALHRRETDIARVAEPHLRFVDPLDLRMGVGPGGCQLGSRIRRGVVDDQDVERVLRDTLVQQRLDALLQMCRAIARADDDGQAVLHPAEPLLGWRGSLLTGCRPPEERFGKSPFSMR